MVIRRYNSHCRHFVVIKPKKRNSGDPTSVMYMFEFKEDAINFINDCARTENVEIKDNKVETEDKLIYMV